MFKENDMVYLQIETEGGEEPGEDVTLRLSNSNAENGYPQEPGALTWLNSARVVADQDEDAVHCLVSVGDPRGAFCFTVRRLPDGLLIIHTPHPGESAPHLDTRQMHAGTLAVGHGTGLDFKPGNYADTEEE